MNNRRGVAGGSARRRARRLPALAATRFDVGRRAGESCLPGLACFEPRLHRHGDAVVTSRWDHRVLLRSVLAGRGHAGAILPAISKVADRGVVWPVLGAVLCLHRATRRAGAGGVGAVLVCSAVTGVVQAAVDRDRPSRLTSLLARGSVARPGSSSFPSTHAANAFAFASAASCLVPALGLGLFPAAAAIGAARVGMAHHYPSDVLAGCVIGAAVGGFVGIATRRAGARPARPASRLAGSWRTRGKR